jgi:hypothetical protein
MAFPAKGAAVPEGSIVTPLELRVGLSSVSISVAGVGSLVEANALFEAV